MRCWAADFGLEHDGYLDALELHLLQHGAAKQTIRVAKCFVELKVVVALTDQQRHRFACGFHCRCELATLALKLGRFQSAVRDNYRRHQLRACQETTV